MRVFVCLLCCVFVGLPGCRFSRLLACVVVVVLVRRCISLLVCLFVCGGLILGFCVCWFIWLSVFCVSWLI